MGMHSMCILGGMESLTLHALRKKLGVKQDVLARRLDANQSTISRLENHVNLPHMDLVSYLEALGVSLSLRAVLPGGEEVEIIQPARHWNQAASFVPKALSRREHGTVLTFTAGCKCADCVAAGDAWKAASEAPLPEMPARA